MKSVNEMWRRHRRIRGKGGVSRPIMMPGGTMGKLAPTKSRPELVKRVSRDHACDSCGMSQIDGNRIAVAKYEVQVPGGSLFFCGSHLRKNWVHILEMNYNVVDLVS